MQNKKLSAYEVVCSSCYCVPPEIQMHHHSIFFKNSSNLIFLIASYAFFFIALIKGKTSSIFTFSPQTTFSRSFLSGNTKFLDTQKGDGYNTLALFGLKVPISTNPLL